MNPPRSVLIVRLSAIGDVIHALPVLDALRRTLPDARLGWIVEELSAPLLESHPQLDRLYVIPKKRWRANFWRLFSSEIRPFFRAVREDGWDAAVDLQGLTKSGLVAWASGARVRAGFAGKESREINRLFTHRRTFPPAEARHVVQRNLSLLRGLGIEAPPDSRGTLGLREDEREAMRNKLVACGWTRGEPLLALNPGAGWESKRWAPGNFAAVGQRVHAETGLRPLILWGPGEEAMRDEIAGLLAKSGTPFLSAPPTRVRELAVLISLSSLFIGGDTGPTHLAAMLDVPVVSIFGASDGHRNRPWPIAGGPMLQRDELECVPCWKTKCPLEGERFMACLRGVEVERVVAAAMDAWEERRHRIAL
ncbi:glycosyltransferase family 9 protein [Candidatus Poribacteria bacterium]|nr:glycosyltransferase family 9 protein [Candidatus Poribacteria bacterium]